MRQRPTSNRPASKQPHWCSPAWWSASAPGRRPSLPSAGSPSCCAPALNLIKGGGGALLREKIVAQASRREVIVVDDSKLSPRLGTHWPLPVEVLEFGWRSQARFLESLGATVTPRAGEGGLYRTDQGNIVLDSRFGPIADPAALASLLDARAGVAGHGLFIGIAHELIVGGVTGVRHIRHGLDPVLAVSTQ
jgi:ribose 5-phosphate isomerase A